MGLSQVIALLLQGYLCVCVTVYTSVPQLVKIWQDSAGTEVVSDHATSRSQAGPNIRLDNKPRLHSLFGQ